MDRNTYYFCTYFDSNYLVKGIALYHSLAASGISFRLWVLCFDDVTYEILMERALPGITPILLSDFEKDDRELLGAKNNRSKIEYYFTCTPSLPLYIFRHHYEVNLLTYLDADLFFFSNPTPIIRGLGEGSVLIIEHCFPPRLSHLQQYGIYNVGWLSFKRDDYALRCLQWWRMRCIEWCYDRCEEGRFADQKYLDNWPNLFQQVVVLHHKGANLAPWNLANYTVEARGNHMFIDDQPLIFFHFHGLHQINKLFFDPQLKRYDSKLTLTVLRRIYSPYIRILFDIKKVFSLSSFSASSRVEEQNLANRCIFTISEFCRKIKRELQLCRKTCAGEYILAVNRTIII